MQEIKATVLERLAAAQADRKAKLDAGRVDTVFKAGGGCCCGPPSCIDATDIGKLRPRWDGPFTVLTAQAPTATLSRCRVALH